MKVTTKRTIYIEMTEDEARGLAAALKRTTASFTKLPEEDRALLASGGTADTLLDFATKLSNAPR